MNLASRIEAVSLRGQVLISDTTFARCRPDVLTAEPVSVYVKGKSSPVTIHEVLEMPALGLKARRHDMRSSPRVKAKLPITYYIVRDKVVIDDDRLDGTATRFASALQNDASLFYVYYIARDCSGLENCTEVSKQSVAVGDVIKVIQRNYVTPGYARGPDPAKLLNPVSIILDGSTRPGALIPKRR